MHHRRSSLALAAWLALSSTALFATGCSDASSGGGTPVEGTDATPVVGDAAVPVPDQGGGGPVPAGSRELRVVGSNAVLAALSSMVMLQVDYIDARGGVPNGRIVLRQFDAGGVEAPGGVEGSGLASFNAITDGGGRATINFVAGPRPVALRIEASAEGAAPVTWNVTVATPGTGGLSVTVTYDDANGRYDYSQLAKGRVDLFSAQDCASLRMSASNLLGSEFSAAIDPFSDVDNSALLGELGAETLSVAVVLQNANGSVVAFGCAPNVTVVPGQVTEISVAATDLPLEYKGRFSVVNKFDLTALLENSQNATLARVGQVLEIIRILGNGDGERGMAVIDLFCDLITDNETLCTIARRIGGPIVDSAFENNAPRALLDVLTVLSDLVEIAGNLTIVGEIEFAATTPTEAGLLPGNENRWQKLRFAWNRGCPAGGDCDRDFTFGDLTLDRRPIAGGFDGQLVGLRMNIGEHALTLRYGLILLGLAQQWLIPAITGTDDEVTIGEVLATLIPCETINGALGEPDSGLCEDILVGALSDILVEQLGLLTFDGDGAFTISGSVEPQDADGDLLVDTLAEGVWSASVRIAGTPIAIDGCFAGCRPPNGQQDCVPADCTIGAVPGN